MKTGSLLNKLINIAGNSKTDFALSMNMTPSGLSKILTGNRLPSLKEKEDFIHRAAEYFTEATYCHGCYLKFKDIFPFLYDFSSEEELCVFLTSAISHALSQDLTASNHIKSDFCDQNTYYLGHTPTCNFLCILLSECFLEDPDAALEIYSSFPIPNATYDSIFSKITITNPQVSKRLTSNFFFKSGLENVVLQNGTEVFSPLLSLVQQDISVNLWRSEQDLPQSFMLIKGHLLLLLNAQIDGAPILTPIFHKSYLSFFYISIMNQGVKKISYSPSEAFAFLEEHPNFIDNLLEHNISHVYSFIPMIYSPEYIVPKNSPASPQVSDMISKLFSGIVTQGTPLLISLSSMKAFAFSRHGVMPLLGQFSLSEAESSEYISTLRSYLSTSFRSKDGRIIHSKLSNMVVLCANDLCIVYITDDAYHHEKLHVFTADILSGLVNSDSALTVSELRDFFYSTWGAGSSADS